MLAYLAREADEGQAEGAIYAALVRTASMSREVTGRISPDESVSSALVCPEASTNSISKFERS